MQFVEDWEMRGQPTIRNGKSASEHTKQSRHQPDSWRLEAGDRAFLFVRCAAPAEKDGLILQMDSTECGFYCEFDESAASLLSLTKVNFLRTFGRILIFQNAKKAKTGCWADSPDFSLKGISMCNFHNFNKNLNFYLLCLPAYAKINAIRPIGELLISLFKTL